MNTFQLFLYNHFSEKPQNYDETGSWYDKSEEWKCYQSLVKNKGLTTQAVGEYVVRLKGEFDDAFSKIDLVRCTQILFIVSILLEKCPFSNKAEKKKDFKRNQCMAVMRQMESNVRLLENRENAHLGKRMLTSVKMLTSYKLADGIRDLLAMLGVASIVVVGIVVAAIVLDKQSHGSGVLV